MTGRLPRFRPGELTPEQRALHRRFTEGPRADPAAAFSLVDAEGRLEGPPNAWLLRPALGAALEQLGGTVRFGLSLPARAREIAVLQVGHYRRSAFELDAHTRAGRAAGLGEEDLAALAAGRPPAGADALERAVHAATAAILADGTLAEDAYWSTVDVLGREGLFELLTLIGWYQLLATQLAVFAVPLPGSP